MDQPTHLVRFTENSVPGWQIHPLVGAHGTPEQPTPRGATAAIGGGSASLVDELVVLVAALVAQAPDVLDLLSVSRTDHEDIRIPDDGFDPGLVQLAASAVAEKARLWIGTLGPTCRLASPETRRRLRDWGIETAALRWPAD